MALMLLVSLCDWLASHGVSPAWLMAMPVVAFAAATIADTRAARRRDRERAARWGKR